MQALRSARGLIANVGEAGVPEHALDVVHQRRAGDASRVRLELASESAGMGAVATTSEIARRPAGAQHAKRLAEDGGLVGRQVDDAVRQDDVDARVAHRQVLDLPEPELDVLGADTRGVRARLADHRRRHVDAQDTSGRSHLLRGQEAVEPGAASEVEHRLAGPQGRDRLRVSAAEAQVRTLRHAGDVLGRVAELQAGPGVWPAAAGYGAAVRRLGVHLADGLPNLILNVFFGHREPPPLKTGTPSKGRRRNWIEEARGFEASPPVPGTGW